MSEKEKREEKEGARGRAVRLACFFKILRVASVVASWNCTSARQDVLFGTEDILAFLRSIMNALSSRNVRKARRLSFSFSMCPTTMPRSLIRCMNSDMRRSASSTVRAPRVLSNPLSKISASTYVWNISGHAYRSDFVMEKNVEVAPALAAVTDAGFEDRVEGRKIEVEDTGRAEDEMSRESSKSFPSNSVRMWARRVVRSCRVWINKVKNAVSDTSGMTTSLPSSLYRELYLEIPGRNMK